MVDTEKLEGLFSGEAVIAHDDALVLRAQKHQAGLEPKWWQEMHPTGRITGWWNRRTNEHLGATEAPPDNEPDWVEMQERAMTLPGGNRLVGYDSTLELRMGNLWQDFRRRYRLGLEAVVQASQRGILQYTGADTSPKHRQEAIRNRLKRHWTVAAYEHDLLIAEEPARLLVEELGKADGMQKWGDTLYLKGFEGSNRKKKPILVKVYRLDTYGLPGVVKLEITLRNEYLGRTRIQGKPMKQPELWETQPGIQSTVEATLRKNWNYAFSRAPKASKALASEMGVTKGDLLKAIADNSRTLTEVLKRLESLESRMERVERHLGFTAVEREREW